MPEPVDKQPIRPAATVVVLRDGVAGLEVLMLRRNSKLAFYGGAWVFPGGRIDPEDAREGDSDPLSVARAAAVRETAEEAGLAVADAELVHFAQWVTPPGRSRRFDTWYFAVRAPAGERVTIDRGEVHDHRWMRPKDALDARDRGEIELPPPTFVTLSQLTEHADADSAYAALSATPVVHYVPRPVPVEGGAVFLYGEDAGYADRNPNAEGPRHRITAIGPTWRYERNGLGETC